jgi:pSer/pThr/pTyr-binding forkhead associated (FHA) protein
MVGDDDLPSLGEPDDDDEATRSSEDLRLRSATGQKKPFLLVVGGRRCLGMLIEVRRKMTIGRAQPVDILLDEEGVSRRHAQVELLGGVVRVTDLDSSNGVRVGGRLVKSHPLRDGERLRLGQAVLTLVHIDDNPLVVAVNLRASADALDGYRDH